MVYIYIISFPSVGHAAPSFFPSPGLYSRMFSFCLAFNSFHSLRSFYSFHVISPYSIPFNYSFSVNQVIWDGKQSKRDNKSILPIHIYLYPWNICIIHAHLCLLCIYMLSHVYMSICLQNLNVHSTNIFKHYNVQCVTQNLHLIDSDHCIICSRTLIQARFTVTNKLLRCVPLLGWSQSSFHRPVEYVNARIQAPISLIHTYPRKEI